MTPDDLAVEVVYGRAREDDGLENPRYVTLVAEPGHAGSAATFTGTVPLSRAGSFGYNVRVVPKHPLLASAAELGLVTIAM